MEQLVKGKLTVEKEISVELYVADKIITTIVQQRSKNATRDAEWKKAAEVLNYYALIFHLIAVIITFGGTFWEDFVDA